jgi:hypothetical protein
MISVSYVYCDFGTNWKFLKLEGKVVEIDLVEYYLTDVNKILGILASGLGGS